VYQWPDPGSRNDAAGGRKPPVPQGLAIQRAVCGVITPQWISLQYASSFFLASDPLSAKRRSRVVSG
jgi:hypothetical protein